jgi:hypothetical protein
MGTSLALVAVVLSLAGGNHPGTVKLAAATVPSSGVSPVVEVSGACSGQNAEVEEASHGKDVYVEWIGCGGIGFARSTDGGLSFSPGVTLPGSVGDSWDPAVAVAPDGTLYAAYMHAANHSNFPVVDVSFDQGASFPRVTPLTPPFPLNWGDRDFIAVGPQGEVYLTWDYGPSAAAVKDICSPSGSCGFETGDLNVVAQQSSDQGKTWSPIVPVSPGFPASGGDSAPMVVTPTGRVDVLYQGYHITNPVTYTMAPAHSYFTSSTNGSTWTAPVVVGPQAGTMSLSEWWIDGDIGLDGGGTLYATWDTQTTAGDIGWLAFSTDGGRQWSAPQRVTFDHDRAVHIVEVAGGAPGEAFVAWQTDSSPLGYATYIRPFSVAKGWLAPPIQVSNRYGNPAIWPGDTFGITVLADGSASQPARVAMSWGSAVGASKDSEIYAAVVTMSPGSP